MVDYTLTEVSNNKWKLRLFWGRILIEEHDLQGSEEEAKQQKSRLIDRLYDWVDETL